MPKPILVEILSLFIIILFLYTGFDKLYHFANFRLQLQLSPWPMLADLSGIVSWLLPFIEIAIAGMLVWPPLQKTGFIFSAVLFIVFIFYISILLGSEKKLPCSCGGIISYLSWKQHLAFNILFLFISIAGFFLIEKHRKLQQTIIKPSFN